MKITRWAELGILCSIHIASRARKDQTSSCSAQEISESLNIPFQYTQQILHRLKKGKIIQALRGPKGGYRLARPSEEISLKDILFATEGSTFELICEAGPIYEQGCQSKSSPCGLQRVWRDLQHTIDNFLSERSLAWMTSQQELVKGGEQLVQLVYKDEPRAEASLKS